MARVLLAEDEPALLDAYADLVRALGHECVCAVDANEALTLAGTQKPDVVVTDYMMPGKSGVELARAFKADPNLADIPFVLLSAGRPNERDRGDVWRFLPKPVSIDVFEANVRDAVDEAQRRSVKPAPSRASFTHVSPISFAREEMLSWVSHEIKSPLAAAMTATQLAQRALDNGDDREAAKKRLVVIARQLTRMNELVNSLLDAAALQDGKLELERAAVDAVVFMEQCVAYWSELHPDVRFDVTHAEGTAEIDGDRERMRQIVDNLISNAIKYGRPGNHVTVAVTPDDGHIRLSVTDRGRGIPAEELPRIFDRFHRVVGQGGRGHGLGLYIAAALARLHGGAIEVTSEVGAGSTFTAILPRYRRTA